MCACSRKRGFHTLSVTFASTSRPYRFSNIMRWSGLLAVLIVDYFSGFPLGMDTFSSVSVFIVLSHALYIRERYSYIRPARRRSMLIVSVTRFPPLASFSANFRKQTFYKRTTNVAMTAASHLPPPPLLSSGAHDNLMTTRCAAVRCKTHCFSRTSTYTQTNPPPLKR